MQCVKIGTNIGCQPIRPVFKSDDSEDKNIKTIQETCVFKDDKLVQKITEINEDGKRILMIEPIKDGKPIKGAGTKLNIIA